MTPGVLRTEHLGDMTADAVAVGIGPFNLSLAALAHGISSLRLLGFDRKPAFAWHKGLMLDDANIQVSFLKDLVTPVDPSSPFSFLCFLRAHRRLYHFLHAGFDRVSRREFDQYFGWVAANLPSLRFGQAVESVDYDGRSFTVLAGGRQVRTNNVVLGTGQSPVVPTCARRHLGGTVFHASDFLPQFADGLNGDQRRVAVVGGGQSGAEVCYELLTSRVASCSMISWITKRSNFLPLDESPFTNELFTPDYSDHFSSLGPEARRRLLCEQHLASNGVSTDLLEKLYRRIYEYAFVRADGPACTLLPGRELVHLHPSPCGWELVLRDEVRGTKESVHAEIVILATGYEYRSPECLAPLADRLGEPPFALGHDFAIAWDAPPHVRLFLQNGADGKRGIADANLSLMAWRAATILNAIMGRAVFELEESPSLVGWGDVGDERTAWNADDARAR